MQSYKDYFLIKEAVVGDTSEAANKELYNKVAIEIETIFNQLLALVQTTAVAPATSSPSNPYKISLGDWWSQNQSPIIKEQSLCGGTLENYYETTKLFKEVNYLLTEVDSNASIIQGLTSAKIKLLDLARNIIFNKTTKPYSRVEAISKWIKTWKAARERLPSNATPATPATPEEKPLAMADAPSGSKIKAVDPKLLGSPVEAPQLPTNPLIPVSQTNSSNRSANSSNSGPRAVFKDVTDESKLKLDNEDDDFNTTVANIVSLFTKMKKDFSGLEDIAKWLKDENLMLNDFAPDGRFKDSLDFLKTPTLPKNANQDNAIEMPKEDSDDWAYLIGQVAYLLASRNQLNPDEEAIFSKTNIAAVRQHLQSMDEDDKLEILASADKDGPFRSLYDNYVRIGKALIDGKVSAAEAYEHSIPKDVKDKIDKYMYALKTKAMTVEQIIKALENESSEDKNKIHRIIDGSRLHLDAGHQKSNMRKILYMFYTGRPMPKKSRKPKTQAEQLDYYIDLLRSGKKHYGLDESFKRMSFDEKLNLIKTKLSSVAS